MPLLRASVDQGAIAMKRYSDGNRGILCIPQSSSITGYSPSDCLVSYPGHPLVGWVLSSCRDEVGVFCKPGRLVKVNSWSDRVYQSSYDNQFRRRKNLNSNLQSSVKRITLFYIILLTKVLGIYIYIYIYTYI